MTAFDGPNYMPRTPDEIAKSVSEWNADYAYCPIRTNGERDTIVAALRALSPPEPTEGQAERERCAQILDAEAAFARDQLAAITQEQEDHPNNKISVRYHWQQRAAIAETIAKHIRSIVARAMPLQDHADCHGLDNERQVFFYEQNFYVLSNFSSFTLQWRGLRFDTSEAAYHWEKFAETTSAGIRDEIWTAPSAHEAFKIAERNRAWRHPEWDEKKVAVMRDILRAKADQHEYVRRKLLATGERELIENSWRDDFWGWGRNRDGQNMLGKLWMEVRAEIRPAIVAEQGTK